jgi:hypothetical protein
MSYQTVNVSIPFAVLPIKFKVFSEIGAASAPDWPVYIATAKNDQNKTTHLTAIFDPHTELSESSEISYTDIQLDKI